MIFKALGWSRKAQSLERRIETLESFARALDNAVADDYDDQMTLELEVFKLTARVDELEVDYEA